MEASVPGDNVPLNVPPMIIPETVSIFCVPSKVMFGCAGVTIFPAMPVEVIAVRLLNEVMASVVDCDKVPFTVPALMLATLMVVAVTRPATVNVFKVPSKVIAGWVAVTIFPLMLVAVMAARLPSAVMPAILAAERTPLKVPASTVPADRVPATVNAVNVPSNVILG
jgi:hypothetical protein